jgi:tetratricopeptide (TPR) repeat protein
MRWVLLLALLVAPALADEADEYFAVGLRYLRTGHYEQALDCFSESLMRAPGEAVPMAFSGIAAAASGRHPSESAMLLRTALHHLGDKRRIRLDLRKQLPSATALAMLHTDYVRRLRGTRERLRRDILGVLAFLEIHDGTPKTAPHLDELLEAFPESAYGRALDRVRKPAAKRKPVAP